MKQWQRILGVGLLSVGLWLGATGIWAAENVTANGGASNVISKITVTFCGDPVSKKGFTWYSPLEIEGSDLQVVEKRRGSHGLAQLPDFRMALRFKGRSLVATNSLEERVHKAEAVGLKPNTGYYYRVGDAKRNLWSETGLFQTAVPKGPFTFVDLTDTQAKNEAEAALSAQTIAKALRTVPDAKFLALNGDLVDTGSKEEQWKWLLGNAQSSFLNTTFLPVAGNHEKQTNSFIGHFNLNAAPGSRTETGVYYSLDYCNTHLVILNNNENSVEYSDFTPEQIQWLKDDVREAKASGAKWVIVLMHKGPYTTSNHATDVDIMGENGVRTKVAPLLVYYPTKI